tara:strand:- start:7227 stop:7709 length:483 start_codon:yes stop_codon:yes gene_type:complete
MSTSFLKDYNAKDIYTLFTSLYVEKHGVEYKGAGFIGNEMHGLRGLIDEYGAAHVACATLTCVATNDRTVNIPYFVAGIKFYLIPHNPDVYWAVKRYGTPEMSRLWKKFLFLDSVWFPTATQRMNYKLVLKQLKEWAHEKTGKAAREINSKSAKKRASSE